MLFGCRSSSSLFAIILVVSGAIRAGATIVWIGSVPLRQQAAKVAPLHYPVSSVSARRGGVVSAELRVSNEGVVTDVKVLEAPDEAISNSVGLSLRQWRFSPIVVNGSAVEVRGRLVFYFRVNEGGQGVIIDAAESKMLKRR